MAVERDPLAALKMLGDLSGPRSRAADAPRRLKVNAHIHIPPNFSAFSSVREAVELAAAQDVRVVGVSNYYHFGAYATFAEHSHAMDVFPLFGLEVICLLDDLVQADVKINDPGNPGKMYLCGKGVTRFAPMSGDAVGLMDTIRRNDSTRIATMIERVARLFEDGGVDTGVTEASVKAAIVQRHGLPLDTIYLQERHVAQAFQEAVFARVSPETRTATLRAVFGSDPGPGLNEAVRLQSAIRTHLMKAGKRGYVDETFVGFDHAYRLILALGGVPCYPVLADGAAPICPFEDPLERLVRSLRDRRIYCAELIPNRNSPQVLAAYARGLRAAGIVVLAGTEHNTLEMLPMEPQCAGGIPIPEAIKEVFWEGALVVAAHQYLTANGQMGYVDESGALNPAYTSGEARIEAFAQLGESVIQRYGRVACASASVSGRGC